MSFAARSRVFSAVRAALLGAALFGVYRAYGEFEGVAGVEDHCLSVGARALNLQRAWSGAPGAQGTAQALAALGETIASREPDRPAFTEIRRLYYALPRPDGAGRPGIQTEGAAAAGALARLALLESQAALQQRNRLLISVAMIYSALLLALLALEAWQHLSAAAFFLEFGILKAKLLRYAEPFYPSGDSGGELERLELAADALDITLENSMLARIRLARDTSQRLARMRVQTRALELTRRKVVTLVEDLEQARAELQKEKLALKLTGEKLARSNKELEQFAYVASHDLKEPLRVVSSFSGLLTKRYAQALDGDARDFIGYIDQGARRATDLVNALFNYSKVTYTSREFSDVDCAEAFNKAVFNLKIAIEERKASVTRSGLPVVRGDEFQLIQLFQNLLSNSLKFNASPAPEIKVTAVRSHDDWVISFEDNGIGIPAEHFDRIFLIFQRLHAADKYPGAGIGLALCKKIAENHGGRIWVESESGRGSVFRVALPAAAAAAAPGQAGAPAEGERA